MVGEMLGRLAMMGNINAPFWMRMEIFSAVQKLTLAREDIAHCYHALYGDMHWNERGFHVFTTLIKGQAPWSIDRGSNPQAASLSSWVAGLDAHVQFLGKLHE